MVPEGLVVMICSDSKLSLKAQRQKNKNNYPNHSQNPQN